MIRRSGFTLIELLVVIGILGLLAGFLAPRFLGVQDRAKEAAVKMVMQDLQRSIEAYSVANEVYPLGKDINVKDLCEKYLMSGEFVIQVPKNPFTSRPYTDQDASGKIIYSFDDVSGKYTLAGYGHSGIRKILELSNQ